MTDDRLPGMPLFQSAVYVCPACGEQLTDEIQLECPRDGTTMERLIEDPDPDEGGNGDAGSRP